MVDMMWPVMVGGIVFEVVVAEGASADVLAFV
jgi:hypothetical protein